MKPIRVYDQQLNMLTETDNYLSLQFNPRFYEVGDFELHINQYVEGAEYFIKGNLIVLDKREDKAMLIRHREIALDQNGKVTENWRITGVTLKGVLDQRVTIPPDGGSHDRIRDNAETVMKHYVDNHFVNPVDPSRKIDLIEIAPDKKRGIQIEWESRYKNVADELTAISKQANLGWVMYADIENKKWIFDVIEPRDVTQGNEAGLQPVFFSPDFSTIKTQQFVDSDNNYKNVGFVGGQGEGVERKIVKIGESEGMDLREVFIDARDVSETDEETEEELSDEEYEQLLIERGERRMREFETTFYLEAQILTPSINRNNDFAMSTPFEYETDFRLGDLVEVFNKNWNITMDAPITEFTEIHEPSGFILEAIFGEAQPTLITKIRDKFNELEGIEKQELPARLAVERMRDAMQYGDERLSEEEQARIEQALDILDESKEWADEQAYQAEQEAKRHADDQDIVYDEIAKEDASEKSGQAREDAKQHADQQDEIVRDDAAQDATDKADRAEDNAKGHADDRADEAERNAKDYTDENAVDRDTYEVKMQEIADDLEEKAGIEYVDGQLQFKADSDVVQAIDDTVDGLLGTASDLEQAVIDHADALAEQDGRIIDVETELDTVEGNLSLVITDLSNLDDTVSQQGIDISANAEAISFKANQDDLDTVSGDVSSLSGSLDVLAGEVSAKAERSTVESLQTDFDNLEVGGRNLLRDSKEFTREPRDTGYNYINLNDFTETLKDGQEYTFSSDVEIAQGEFDVISVLKRKENGDSSGTVGNLSIVNGRIEGSFIAEEGDGRLYVYMGRSGETNNNQAILRNVKLEKGNRATDWTPAPEDIDSQFNTVTNELGELTVSVEGIEGNVSSLTQTVGDHGTDISDLSAEFIVLADEITNKVDATYIDGVISDIEGDLTDITGDVQTLSGSVSTLAGEVELKASQSDLNAIEGRLSTAEGELSVLPGQIELKADSEYVDDVEQRVTSAELTIDGLEGEITSKVEADDVRSIFTQEAGSFTFDADQINFDGHVFGEDATFAGEVEGAIIRGSRFEIASSTSTMSIDTGFSGGQINWMQAGDDQAGIGTRLRDDGRLGLDIHSNGYLDLFSLQGVRISGDITLASENDRNGFLLEYETGNRGSIFAYSTDTGDREVIMMTADEFTYSDGGASIYLYSSLDPSLPGRLRMYAHGERVIDVLPNRVNIETELNMNNINGVSNALIFGGTDLDHFIGSYGQNHFTFYGNRSSGRPFHVRSHSNRSSYRDDFWVDSAGQVFSPPTVDATTGQSADMSIATNTGRFRRSTSSLKYKLLPETMDIDPYKLLAITPKDWYDKGDIEAYADELTRDFKGLNVNFDNLDLDYIRRIPGIVAEDVHDLGLTSFVKYKDGEVDGLMYDRLWTLLIPITRDHEEKITDLYLITETHGEKIKRLESEIEKLKGVA